jgi:hypothetical protein
MSGVPQAAATRAPSFAVRESNEDTPRADVQFIDEVVRAHGYAPAHDDRSRGGHRLERHGKSDAGPIAIACSANFGAATLTRDSRGLLASRVSFRPLSGRHDGLDPWHGVPSWRATRDVVYAHLGIGSRGVIFSSPASRSDRAFPVISTGWADEKV